MILIILADARQIGHDVDAVPLQMRRGPMPDSCRIFGVASAPAVSTISRRALIDDAILEQHAGRAPAFEHHLVDAGSRS